MARHDSRTVLELRAGDIGAEELAVGRVRGHERLSEPYAFDVDFSHRDGAVLSLAELAGAPAALSLCRPGGAERHVHGMLLRIELTGVTAGVPAYRARIVPKLERLRLVTRSRVFQARSAPDVVKKVLDDAGIECRLSLSGRHPVREYCVQYRESDLQFVSRLLEDEGIFYFFEHGPDSHVLVLADANGACRELDGGAALPFRHAERPGDEDDEEEHLSRIERVHGARTGKVSLSDFDFERPLMSATGAADSGDGLGLEWYEHPAGVTQPSAVAARSRLRLEELRFGVETFEGSGTCLRFAPGAAFDVEGHPDPDLDRRLLLVEVTHEAVQQESAGGVAAVAHGYRGKFVALDAGAPYRPRRRTRRPAAVAETATVVGPAGEEVHVDRLGRVKVQFHWDREGRRDDRSSCFVRLAQAWAGPAWGASLVPRIGQEVLVRFVEGDPDRPMVTGAVYNGASPPPVLLPADKTRSTLRSDSSPGGGGANELLFEDQKDAEAVSLHARKDMRVEVLNDARRRIGGDAAEAVGKDRQQRILGNHALAVAAMDQAAVMGSQTLTVSGDRTTAVGAHAEQVAQQQSVTVGGNQDVRADAAAVETIGAAAALNVGAAYAVNVAGVLNEAVGGLKSGQVAGARVEIVGAARSETVSGDARFDVGGDFLTEAHANVGIETGGTHDEKVGGAAEVESKEPAYVAAKEIQLEGTDRLSFVVDGKEVLSIESSGAVTFGAAGMNVEGDSLALKGGKLEKKSAGSAASAQAQVTQLEPAPEDKAFIEIELVDQDGNPAVNEWFRVEFPDGTVREGKLDGKGHAWVPGPREGTCKVTFPRLDKRAWEAA